MYLSILAIGCVGAPGAPGTRDKRRAIRRLAGREDDWYVRLIVQLIIETKTSLSVKYKLDGAPPVNGLIELSRD